MSQKSQYHHLSEIPSVKLESKWRWLEKLLFGNRLAKGLAKKIEKHQKNQVKNQRTLISIARLHNSAEDSGANAEEYGYVDALDEIKTALLYKYEIADGFPKSSESKKLYDCAEDLLTRYMDSTSTVVNFGVCYAHIDQLLARKFPSTMFYGVDRSRITKALNEVEFGGIPNLLFVASDIFEFLESAKLSNWMLFHTRTCCLLPKDFVVRLYNAAYKLGCSTIVCLEQSGISRQTGCAYQYSDNDQASVAYRQGMLIHNYPGILRAAGFEVVESTLIKTAHNHEDYRIVEFVANRT